jgi:mono/diheme cytochrome c family protein
MKRFLRGIGITLLSIACLAMVAYGAVYAISENMLRHAYPIPTENIAIPTDAASIAEGKRLATVHGCFGGCHGNEVEGGLFFDMPAIARLNSPNLTASVRKYSDAELVAIIKHGLRPNGRSVVVMPSEAFVLLKDEDLGRIGLVSGKFNLVAKLIATTVPPPAATSEAGEHGRYMARTTCAQCNGRNLRGDSNPDFTAPVLQIVAACSQDAFKQLLREGVGLGGRKLATMGSWARQCLSSFTDPEIADLYTYLHAMENPGSN